eukprot:1196687-Rhodomonas_salina.1
MLSCFSFQRAHGAARRGAAQVHAGGAGHGLGGDEQQAGPSLLQEPRPKGRVDLGGARFHQGQGRHHVRPHRRGGTTVFATLLPAPRYPATRSRLPSYQLPAMILRASRSSATDFPLSSYPSPTPCP